MAGWRAAAVRRHASDARQRGRKPAWRWLTEWVWRGRETAAEAASWHEANSPWKRLMISVRGRIMTLDPW